jgi:hypothetical protein
MDPVERNKGDFFFIRATYGQDVTRRFLISVIFTSREEAETALKAEYARHEAFGYNHEVVHVAEVTPQEVQYTLQIMHRGQRSPADCLFESFWRGRAEFMIDPILAAVYAVASGALRPDIAVEEIRKHYGIPVAVPMTHSSVSPN